MSQHTDHAVVPVSVSYPQNAGMQMTIPHDTGGWRCEACPDLFPALPEALAHAIAHQYQVAPMKPLPEREGRVAHKGIPWSVPVFMRFR